MAGLVAAQGQAQAAARFLGAAEAIRSSIGAPLQPVQRAAYERTVAAARSALGNESFATAWAEGQAMSPEQAADAALIMIEAFPPR